jgi:hypothetical protein
MKLYSVLAMFPGTLGTLFGTYSSAEVAVAVIEKHKKEQEVPAEVIFRIFSYELDEDMPVEFEHVVM